MGFQVDDSAKRRLTDPAEIDRSIQLLEARGLYGDQLLTEMTRIFYVDLDALQGVLAGLAQAEAGHPAAAVDARLSLSGRPQNGKSHRRRGCGRVPGAIRRRRYRRAPPALKGPPISPRRPTLAASS